MKTKELANANGIFRAYDIRGLAEKEVNGPFARWLGKALAIYFFKRGLGRVIVGHDSRLTSPGYTEELVAGLAESGIHVLRLGLVPSPLLYFACKHLDIHAGVMVTASHNPPEYNGFKIVAGESTIHTTELEEIKAYLLRRSCVQGQGLVSEHDILPAYVEAVVKSVGSCKGLDIVLDAGNGAGGPAALAVFQALGVQVIPLYCEPDGNFPGHHPDPILAENMRECAAAVLQSRADLGIGLDGDADRLGVVDNFGKLVYGDCLLFLFARSVLQGRAADSPKVSIIGEVKCSDRLFREIEQLGGKAIMAKTGHSFIKERMRQEKALLAGEMTGHFFFADRGWFGFDDAIYAGARLLRLITDEGKPLDKLLESWPQTFSTPELRVDCPEECKDSVVKEIGEIFAKDFKIINIDGVRMLFPDGWGLVRASNTQSCLVLRFEADSAKSLEHYQKMVEGEVDRLIRKNC